MRALAVTAVLFVACGSRDSGSEVPPAAKPEWHFVPSSAASDMPNPNWWCIDNPGVLSSCYRVRYKCDESRERLIRQMGRENDHVCQVKAHAACFTLKNKLEGNDDTECFSSFADCGAGKAIAMQGKEDDWALISDCKGTD